MALNLKITDSSYYAYAIIKRMNSRYSAGYTILEVMIVMMVTSALFIATAATMSGKQERSEFLTGIRSLESSIQTVASEVSAGHYQNGYQCTASGGSKPNVDTANATNGPGSNTGCIFLGKVMHFGFNNGLDYNVYTVVGRREASTGGAATSLDEAQPVVVEGTGNSPDLTDYKKTDWGISVTRVIVKGSPDIDVGSIGFLNQLTGDIAGGNPATGSRSLKLIGVTGTTISPATSKSATVLEIEATTPTQMIDAPDGLVMCVTGRNNQKGEINIGGVRGRSTTNVLIDDGVSSAC